MKKKNRIYLVALLPFIIIVGLFELAPLASILVSSFSPEGKLGFTFDNFIRIFTTDLYINSIKGSIEIAIFSSIIGILVACFGAKALKESKGKMGKFFKNVLNITSNFAGIPLAFAFMILLGNVGVLTLLAKSIGLNAIANFDLYSINGLMLTYIYFQIPLATLLLLPSFNILKKQWSESVKLLGGNSFIYWIKVGIPNLMPSILGTFSVLFSNSLEARPSRRPDSRKSRPCNARNQLDRPDRRLA